MLQPSNPSRNIPQTMRLLELLDKLHIVRLRVLGRDVLLGHLPPRLLLHFALQIHWKKNKYQLLSLNRMHKERNLS